jgi:hypothetical protein
MLMDTYVIESDVSGQYSTRFVKPLESKRIVVHVNVAYHGKFSLGRR